MDGETFYRYEIDAGDGKTIRYNPMTKSVESVPCRKLVVGPGYEGGGISRRKDAVFIAAHDPRWRLGDITRKREILADCVEAARVSGATWVLADRTLRRLAAEFAGRPGWRAEWSVNALQPR